MRQIEVLVRPTGLTTTTVTGVKGADCHKLTAGLEARFGATVDAHNTEEFYEEPIETEIEQKRG